MHIYVYIYKHTCTCMCICMCIWARDTSLRSRLEVDVMTPSTVTASTRRARRAIMAAPSARLDSCRMKTESN